MELTGSRGKHLLQMVTLRRSTEMAKPAASTTTSPADSHRYSVDERWLVPHFEKMLYDQAQLAISYIEAFQITGGKAYASIARDVLDYVMRDMTHPEGGFYSAEDADSVIDPAEPKHKGEGAFYIWTRAELAALLNAEELDEVCHVYGIEPSGNVEEDPHSEFTGRNILYVAQDAKNPAVLQTAKSKMLAARNASKVRPYLDDKVLTAWNGLMISAFAKAASALDEPLYLQAAERAAHFILKHLYRPEDARLRRRFRDGDSAIEGFLDDYAFFGNALLDLYAAGFNPYYFELAVQLGEQDDRAVRRPGTGWFFQYARRRRLVGAAFEGRLRRRGARRQFTRRAIVGPAWRR